MPRKLTEKQALLMGMLGRLPAEDALEYEYKKRPDVRAEAEIEFIVSNYCPRGLETSLCPDLGESEKPPCSACWAKAARGEI